MSIKRGVSLYSYQQTQLFGIMNLWQEIEEVREGLGTDGIEIISQQAVRGYPFPSDAFVGQWHETMSRLGMTAVAYARSRSVSVTTVYTHLRRTREKTGWKSVAELTRRFHELNVTLRAN